MVIFSSPLVAAFTSLANATMFRVWKFASGIGGRHIPPFRRRGQTGGHAETRDRDNRERFFETLNLPVCVGNRYMPLRIETSASYVEIMLTHYINKMSTILHGATPTCAGRRDA